MHLTLSQGLWGWEGPPTCDMRDKVNDMWTLENVSNNIGITTISWNCRGIFNQLPEVSHILTASDCEIGIFVEGWLSESIDNDMIMFNNYNTIRQDRSKNSNQMRAGGIIIYHKEQLDITLGENLWQCTSDIELVVFELNLINVWEIYFLLIYRPPSGSEKKLHPNLRQYHNESNK